MTLSVGNLGIDGLEDIEQIGTGGSSRVYRARQTELDRVVAVKVLNPGYDQSVSKRFDRERKAMGRLSLHEGIVPVYSSGITGHGEPFLVMPYYPNGSLQDQIDTGAMEWQTAVSYVDVAAETIAAAHEEGVVHLDLKPANILLTNNGAPRIADFGIAKLTSGQGASAGTTGGAAFTPAYSAPETFLDGETGPPSDVYGLGATLWALLVGHPPFLTPGDDTNLMAVIGRVVNNAVGDLRHFTPAPICEVIERAMAKRPEDRFQTARDFSMALKQAAAASSPEFAPQQDNRGTALFPAAAALQETSQLGEPLTTGQPLAGATAAYSASGQASRPLLQESAQPVGDAGAGPPPVAPTPFVDLDRFRAGPILLGLLAFVSVIGLSLWGLNQGDSPESNGTVEVPVTDPASPSATATGASATTTGEGTAGSVEGQADDQQGGVGATDGNGDPVDSSLPNTTVATPSTTEPASSSTVETTAAESTTSSTEDPTPTTEDPTTTLESTTTSEATTTTELTTTTLESTTTSEATTTTELTTTTVESTTTTIASDEPPEIKNNVTTSSTASSITASFSATQCVTYRVSAKDLNDPAAIPVVRNNRNGTCALSHTVTIDGLAPDTQYEVAVIVTNEAGVRSTAKTSRRRTK